MGPTLAALTFAGVEHAQGTMDFSGAQTLMGTFKTFASAAATLVCIELLRRIHKGQVSLGRFRLEGQTAPALWDAILAA
jgi:hypothetical protein